ncbi:MAG: UDP-2,3-diacylglucosamine pyrophosphatase LpxG [Phycisphaerae bacterium]|nr:UDP-2,3-diacylglucosamine pyrophosphatase LpxG [Phycisphaerae bacterium]
MLRLRIVEQLVQVRATLGSWQGTRLAYVSDLHFRQWLPIYDELRQQLLRLQPDLLLLGGDFDDGGRDTVGVIGHLHTLLDGLHFPEGIFAVSGNHDHPELVSATAGLLRFLNNESVWLQRGPDRLLLAGVAGWRRDSWDLPSALWEHDPNCCSILMSHYPHVLYHLPPQCVDLLLAGHTHGGQVRLPGWGSIWLPFDGLPRRYSHGAHRLAQTHLYVSAGIGYSRTVRFRWFCPPELVVIRLVNDNQQISDGKIGDISADRCA